MSVYPSVRLVRIGKLSFCCMDFREILYWEFLLKCAEKIQVCFQRTKIACTLREDVRALMIFHCILFGLRRVSDKRHSGN
jgi:hypothetical protein